MSSAPKNTPDPTAIETDEPEVIRKPITVPVESDDNETQDGPRSTKNDREINLSTEISEGDTDDQENTLSIASEFEHKMKRKSIVIEMEPEE